MARLNWREILADDGTNDGWETTNGRWVISSIRHIASGTVEYFFERCPMLDTEERRETTSVYEVVDDVPQVVKGDDGKPLKSEQVWLEVVRDERPPGSTDIDEMKALAKAYEDGPTAYAEFEGERTARRQQRRGQLLEQRHAEQRRVDIEAIIGNPDLIDALADALQARGG